MFSQIVFMTYPTIYLNIGLYFYYFQKIDKHFPKLLYELLVSLRNLWLKLIKVWVLFLIGKISKSFVYRIFYLIFNLIVYTSNGLEFSYKQFCHFFSIDCNWIHKSIEHLSAVILILCDIAGGLSGSLYPKLNLKNS